VIGLRNPDSRRALRSIVEAIVALALVGLLYWLVSLLSAAPAALTGISRGCLIIIGLNALMYGAENVTRAIKLTGPAGFGAEFGSDAAPVAAQTVADAAQTTADQIKETTP
jgi:hypothetical protein